MKKLIHHRNLCLECAGCVGVCPENALDMFELELQIDSEKCSRCGICVKACPSGALELRTEK
ncbi:MAG: 4Fe-4S binding protein [Fibrobacter sp.]|nr:4Fe-4S binding protein [Fibrobacter sp.]